MENVQIDYLVVEKGIHHLHDGTMVVAGRATVHYKEHNAIYLDSRLEDYVLLASLNTNNR